VPHFGFIRLINWNENYDLSHYTWKQNGFEITLGSR